MNFKKPPTTTHYIIFFTMGIIVTLLSTLYLARNHGDGFALIPSLPAFLIIWLLGIIKLTPAKTIKHKIMLLIFIIIFNPVSGVTLVQALDTLFERNYNYPLSSEDSIIIGNWNSSKSETNKQLKNTIANEIIESELGLLTKHTILVDRYQLQGSDNGEVYTIWLYAKEKPTKEEMRNIGTQMATVLTKKNPGYLYTFIMFPDTSIKQVGDSLPYDSYQTFYWKDDQIIFGTE